MKKIFTVASVVLTVILCLFLGIVSFCFPNAYFHLYRYIGIYAVLLLGVWVLSFIAFMVTRKKQKVTDKDAQILEDIKYQLIEAYQNNDHDQIRALSKLLEAVHTVIEDVREMEYYTRKKRHHRHRPYGVSQQLYVAELTDELSDEDEDAKQMEELLQKFMPNVDSTTEEKVEEPIRRLFEEEEENVS